MLEARSLHYSHDRQTQPLLAGVDLSVRRGEVVGLSGPSGTGKTTLGRLLAGYLEPQAGKVIVDGRPLPRHGIAPVQLVFQHPELAVDPRWRLREVLDEAGPTDPSLLDELAISPGLLSRYPVEVSGGELQRIAVARALQTGAPFLIADEMSAMLDSVTQAQLWHAVLRRVGSGDLGVVAISHDNSLLRVVADRTLRMAGSGRLSSNVTPDSSPASHLPRSANLTGKTPARS